MTDPRLDAIGRRIERIVVAPEKVSAPLTRLVRPLMARKRWRPKARVVAIQQLLASLADEEDARRRVGAAVRELSANVSSVERACVIERRVPVAHAAWLRQLYEVVVQAVAAIAPAGEGRSAAQARADVSRRRLASQVHPSLLLAPLVAGPEAPLVELELGAVDRLLASARKETRTLGRRRRLLEAARQLLLEAAAAVPLEQAGVDARLRMIGHGITHLDRLQAAGVEAEVGLVHQARSALARNDRDRLYATLVALDGAAVAGGDGELARTAGQAIHKLDGGARFSAAASIDRSANQLLGDEVVARVNQGYQVARARLTAEIATSQLDPDVESGLRALLAPGAERSTLAAAQAAGGCFEAGGVLSPVRVTEDEIHVECVRWPTRDLVLLPARDAEDLANAVIEDPRLLLLSLASGRLLTRRFVREEVRPRRKTVRSSEVRVYLLDGSTSMLGPRARMRDALLVAELATLHRRLTGRRAPGATRPVLYYGYFNHKMGPLHRVDQAEEALDTIPKILSTARTGGTDIEGALLAGFDKIHQARRDDSELARAQIVLVTDGEAGITESAVEARRQRVADLPVGVSVIALGQENPVLRSVVAGQRAQGARAFYHFLDDGALTAVAEGKIDDGSAIHLPPAAPLRKGELSRSVGELVEELAAIERGRDAASLSRVATSGADGERAQIEAQNRDRSALAARFARWFPLPATDPPAGVLPEARTLERQDLETVTALLATVVEVVDLLEGTELVRQAEAIELVESLLPDARLSPARYLAVLKSYPTLIAEPLRTLHDSVRLGLVRRLRPR